MIDLCFDVAPFVRHVERTVAQAFLTPKSPQNETITK
jgi:hypothetical protein